MRQLKIAKQVTNRETASLDKYLQEIGRVDLITADEEVELARRIRAGDRAALVGAFDKSESSLCGFRIQTISKSRACAT